MLRRCARYLRVAAVAPLLLAAVAQAQFGVPVPSVPPPGPTTPVVVTGRIVTEDGQPVPGVRFMVAPQPGPMGLPEVPLFLGVPAKCFTGDSGTPVTDSQGRYRFTANFLPEQEVRGTRCSSYAARLRREYLNLGPMPTGSHQFRVATGPLPMPRANVPAGAIKPQKTLPRGTFDPSRISR